MGVDRLMTGFLVKISQDKDLMERIAAEQERAFREMTPHQRKVLASRGPFLGANPYDSRPVFTRQPKEYGDPTGDLTKPKATP